MNYSIRNVATTDLPTLEQWWSEANEPTPSFHNIPETTFVMEVDATPVMSIALVLTNTPGRCYIENFIASPSFTGQARKQASQLMVDYVTSFAKNLGYKYIMCFAYREKLAARYEQLGMIKTMGGVSTFVKELR